MVVIQYPAKPILSFDQLTVPPQQRIGFEKQNYLLQLGFPQLDDRSDLLHQGQQQQLFREGDSRSAFLMTPHNEKLLAQQQELNGLVIRRKPTEA